MMVYSTYSKAGRERAAVYTDHCSLLSTEAKRIRQKHNKNILIDCVLSFVGSFCIFGVILLVPLS
jgi:hypothetical protein